MWFVRGLGNALFGWSELIFRPIKMMNNGENIITAVTVGIGNSLERTGSGVVDLLTFWNPNKGGDIALAKDCPICALKE